MVMFSSFLSVYFSLSLTPFCVKRNFTRWLIIICTRKDFNFVRSRTPAKVRNGWKWDTDGRLLTHHTSLHHNTLTSTSHHQLRTAFLPSVNSTTLLHNTSTHHNTKISSHTTTTVPYHSTLPHFTSPTIPPHPFHTLVPLVTTGQTQRRITTSGDDYTDPR